MLDTQAVVATISIVMTFLKRFYLFLERGEGREKAGRESRVASCTPPAKDLAHNPGMWYDWDSNQQMFAGQHPIH